MVEGDNTRLLRRRAALRDTGGTVNARAGGGVYMDKTALNVLVDEHRGAAERVRAVAL